MIRISKIIIFTLTTVFLLTPLYSKDVVEKMAIRRISDDMKFKNGDELYQIKEYSKAFNVFNEYLEVYYDGIHRKEAFKKIADIHIKNFDYQKAISVYRELYLEFSNTEEGIDAYFQMAICYKKMGFDEKSIQILDNIIKEHPGTTAAYHSEIQRDLIKLYAD